MKKIQGLTSFTSKIFLPSKDEIAPFHTVLWEPETKNALQVVL